MAHNVHAAGSLSRRTFMHASAAAVALGAVARARADDPVRSAQHPSPRRGTPRDGKLRLGLIGCGGRGTGAAMDLLTAAPEARLVALADVFPDRLEGSRAHLMGQGPELSARVDVPDERCFTGFGAYEQLLRLDVDVVILATPPGFRPLHLDAAVKAGKHCFIEKPVAVDPAGVRSVIASSAEAERRGLCIVAGTQRRHQRCYLEAMERIHGGAIGRIVGGNCYWNQGGLWMNPRQPSWSDTEWQLRNWLYFTWLSGDHIVEQHVHNIDVMNWALGAVPVRVSGSGGRQVRTDPAYGHIFDHFAVELEYPGGVSVTSMCRQIEGCESRVEEVIVGTEGRAVLSHGRARIEGKNPWKFEGPDENPYEQEHRDLVAAITSGNTINEGRRIAESTLTAIMGRMAAYTGKAVAWEKALASTLDLMPKQLDLGPLPAGEVAVPGRTPLV